VAVNTVIETHTHRVHPTTTHIQTHVCQSRVDQQQQQTHRHVLWWADASQWGAAAAYPYVFLQHAVHRHVIVDPARAEVRRVDQTVLMLTSG
jgi:hypothetical protein